MDIYTIKVETIKDFLLTYTDPKPEYSGLMADDMAKMLMSQLEQVELDDMQNYMEKNVSNSRQTD